MPEYVAYDGTTWIRMRFNDADVRVRRGICTQRFMRHGVMLQTWGVLAIDGITASRLHECYAIILVLHAGDFGPPVETEMLDLCRTQADECVSPLATGNFQCTEPRARKHIQCLNTSTDGPGSA